MFICCIQGDSMWTSILGNIGSQYTTVSQCVNLVRIFQLKSVKDHVVESCHPFAYINNLFYREQFFKNNLFYREQFFKNNLFCKEQFFKNNLFCKEQFFKKIRSVKNCSSKKVVFRVSKFKRQRAGVCSKRPKNNKTAQFDVLS
jgi:hypothetical protein